MKKSVISAISVCILIGIAVLVQRNAPPQRVQANVLITNVGRYTSPNGQRVLNVWREKDGRLMFFVKDQKGSGGVAKSFDPGSHWLLCWDDQDRLWSYVPEQDTNCHYWYWGVSEVGSCHVGETGGWDGIPESFLARLPERVRAVYENFRATQKKSKELS